MKRSGLVLGAVMAVLLLAAMFAPTPLQRTASAEQSSNACKGLQNAYAMCRANNPTGNCTAIREQLIAHQCSLGSSGGSQSGS